MKTALLTGATGFIGGALARRLLADGWTVHALLRANSDAAQLPSVIRLHRHDGSIPGLINIIKDASPDMVFHLASAYLADHRPDEVNDLITSNVLFPARLAEAMNAAGARLLINTGTAWQHFGTTDYNPVNLYAATKQACADILRYYHDARGLSVITLKLFDTYGAGDKRRKLVQLLVDTAMSGEPLEMSAGEQIVDLTHVDDVVEAFIVAADRLRSSPTPVIEEYLLSGERLPVRELVALVGDVLGRPVPARLGARAYRDREVMVPVQSRRQLPKWSKQRTLRSCIRDLACS